MTITFTISVPGTLQLTSGQNVDFSTPLLRSAAREGFRLEIAEELGIPNDKIFMHLAKIVGDTVEANEILATKKSTFGIKQIASPKSGVIKLIDHETGSLIIETLSESLNVLSCYFVGIVKEVKDSDILLEVRSSDKYKIKDVVGDFGGELMFCDEQHLSDLTEGDLVNKVVFTESIRPAEAVRLDVLGAGGIVTKNDITEKEGVNSAELEDKDSWAEVKSSKHTHCIVDKKNCTMYLYDVE
ncbi:MAG: hypothetical protein WBO56_00815 [Microgenomates group bacterium]